MPKFRLPRKLKKLRNKASLNITVEFYIKNALANLDKLKTKIFSDY